MSGTGDTEAQAAQAQESTEPDQTNPTDQAIIEATLRLAASRGWRSIALAEIAAASEVSMATLYARFPSKAAILSGFMRHIDRQVLADCQVEVIPDETARDRLFDVMMRRFDALRPFKDGIAAMVAEPDRSPEMLLTGLGSLRRSMAWMLEAAHISSDGLLGRARVKALAGAHGLVMRVWLTDETDDMSQTMAALDKQLRRLDQLAGLVEQGCGWRRRYMGASPPSQSGADAAPA